jgi:hypothetical protein
MAILAANFAYANEVYRIFLFCLTRDQTRNLFFCHSHLLSLSGFVRLTSATDAEAGSAGTRGDALLGSAFRTLKKQND